MYFFFQNKCLLKFRGERFDVYGMLAIQECIIEIEYFKLLFSERLLMICYNLSFSNFLLSIVRNESCWFYWAEVINVTKKKTSFKCYTRCEGTLSFKYEMIVGYVYTQCIFVFIIAGVCVCVFCCGIGFLFHPFISGITGQNIWFRVRRWVTF